MFEKQPKIITLDTISELCNQNNKKNTKIVIDEKVVKMKNEIKVDMISENKIPIKMKKEEMITMKQNIKNIDDKSEEIILWL